MLTKLTTEGTGVRLHVGGLDKQVDEEVLYEIFLQVSPVLSVKIPRDPVTGEHSEFAFVELPDRQSCNYAREILDGVRLFEKAIRIRPARTTKAPGEGDYAIRISGLSDRTGETELETLLGAFGKLAGRPRLERDQDTGQTTGIAVVAFEDPQTVDIATRKMDGQFLDGNKLKVEKLEPNPNELSLQRKKRPKNNP